MGAEPGDEITAGDMACSVPQDWTREGELGEAASRLDTPGFNCLSSLRLKLWIQGPIGFVIKLHAGKADFESRTVVGPVRRRL